MTPTQLPFGEKLDWTPCPAEDLPSHLTGRLPHVRSAPRVWGQRAFLCRSRHPGTRMAQHLCRALRVPVGVGRRRVRERAGTPGACRAAPTVPQPLPTAPGALRDAEQALPSCSEEHRPRDEPRHHGGGRAGEDPEQLPGCGLSGQPAGRRGGEAQCPQEEGWCRPPGGPEGGSPSPAGPGTWERLGSGRPGDRGQSHWGSHATQLSPSGRLHPRPQAARPPRAAGWQR